VSIPTADDEESGRVARYSFDPPRPVREDLEPRALFHGFEPGRNRPDRQFQWGPLLAAAAAGFLIAIFGPCRSTDLQQGEAQQGEELSNLQSELQSARDRAGQLESELSAARESVGEADATDPRAKADAPVLRKEPIAKPEAAKETEPPAATTPTPTQTPISNPHPEPSRTEPERVALAEPQQIAAVSVYDFPDPDAPVVRATSRSGTPGLAALQALAPERAGWTMEAQPTIYWHASDGTRFPCEFKLIREGQDEPLVRVQLPAPDAAGIQRIELSQFGISLDEGGSYRWSVSFVDLEHSGADRAIGGIRRVAPPDTLRAITDAARGPEHLDALERAGLWYDAFDLVTRSIERNPGAENLVARRIAMLARVGIQLPSS
jgi:uncharacterized protein DUF928